MFIEYDTICKSTAEMLSSFEAYNETVTDDNIKIKKIVGSMDAVALYPSIKADESAEIIRNEVIQTNVTFEGLDMDEVGKFLRKNLTQTEIDDKGLTEIIPTKNKNIKNKKVKYKNKDQVNGYDESLIKIRDIFVEKRNDAASDGTV